MPRDGRDGFVVIGPGSIGGFLAARLAATGAAVRVVGGGGGLHVEPRGSRLDEPGSKRDRAVIRVRGGGLDCDGAVSVQRWEGLTALGPGACVLVAVKAGAVGEAVARLGRVPGAREADVWLCQNGLGIDETAREAWPDGAPFGRLVCWFGVRRDVAAGEWIYAGGTGVELAGGKEGAIGPLAKRLRESGLEVRGRGTVVDVEWRKALWNAALNGICALAGVPNGVAVTDPDLRAQAEELVSEALAVGLAEGWKPEGDARAEVFAAAARTGPNLNSMLIDLRARRLTEIDWLNGAIVKKARRLGIDVPRHALVTGLIRAIERTF